MSLDSASHHVLWHEGMFLVPQHFQQADRHGRWHLERLARALRPRAYGLSSLSIDTRALSSGSFTIIACEGIMPDGLVFNAGNEGDPSPSRQLEIPPGSERLAVYLAAPSEAPGAPASSEGGVIDGRATRFRQRMLPIRDADGRGLPREIAVAAPNLRLLFEGEPLDNHVWLKIAEVGRDPSGAIILLERFASPCISLAASPALRGCLRRTIEVTVGRAAELSAQRRSRGRGQIEVAASEFAAYLLLHAINGAIPRLVHLHDQGDAHPEDVFLAMAMLAGQLCTLSQEQQANALPSYRHDDPMASFSAIERALRSLLELAVPARYVPLSLQRAGERVLAAALPEHVLEGARLYLSVSSAFPSEKVLREIPLKAKVASSGRMDALISQAMRGLRLTYLSVPPSEVPIQAGCSYFELGRDGDEWQAARDTRSLAIYLPPDYADARLEFLAVKE